jgi:hypothetical protein
VRSLTELDVRRLYLGEGYSSLFTYCTQALHLAEGAAYNRIEASRAARRFPAILTALEEGAIALTTIRLVAPHLTTTNHQDVLARARHKGKREIEELVASLRPAGALQTAIHDLARHGFGWRSAVLESPRILALARLLDEGGDAAGARVEGERQLKVWANADRGLPESKTRDAPSRVCQRDDEVTRASR